MVLPASGREADRGGRSTAFDAYKNQLFAIIYYRASHARYRSPFGGVTTVNFTVDSRGVVVRSQVRTSSGNEQFDDLAVRIVPAGLQFPPMPAGMPSRLINVTIPLRFEPRI